MSRSSLTAMPFARLRQFCLLPYSPCSTTSGARDEPEPADGACFSNDSSTGTGAVTSVRRLVGAVERATAAMGPPRSMLGEVDVVAVGREASRLGSCRSPASQARKALTCCSDRSAGQTVLHSQASQIEPPSRNPLSTSESQVPLALAPALLHRLAQHGRQGSHLAARRRPRDPARCARREALGERQARRSQARRARR